jgi:hypothetical protein
MELDRPLQVTSETPRQHAEAYLAQVTAEKEAERARGLVHRFQNARTRRGTATTTVVIGDKAVTMIPPSGDPGGGQWDYIVSEVAS